MLVPSFMMNERFNCVVSGKGSMRGYFLCCLVFRLVQHRDAARYVQWVGYTCENTVNGLLRPGQNRITKWCKIPLTIFL